MAVTTVLTENAAQVIADILDTVEGLRVTWYVNDNARPPVAVIGQPEIDYVDPESPFCFATWNFSVVIVVNRNNDRDAQRELSRFVSEAAIALNDAQPDGVFSVEPLTARPLTVTISGTELPSYELRVRLRA